MEEIKLWFTLWVSPRETMREILQKAPNFRLWLLSTLYGLGFGWLLSLSFPTGFSLPFFIIATILSPLVGYVLFSFTGYLFYLTGKWIGGQGSFQAVRSSVAWGSIPPIVNYILLIILALVVGTYHIPSLIQNFGANVGADIVFVIIGVLYAIVGIWGLIIWLFLLAEAQGFSFWKSVLNVIIGLALFFIIVFILMLLVSFVL